MTRHPRLLLGAGGGGAVRRRAARPGMARFMRHIRRYCREVMRADPILPPEIPSSADSRAGYELRKAREAQNRILSLSFLYLLEGRVEYYWRAWREMECWITRWNSWEDPYHATGGFGYDLMVAEMGVTFGLAYDWLHGALTVSQRARIRSAIRERVLDLYLRETAPGSRRVWWFAGNINNWNAICNAGAVVAALALRDEYPRWREVVGRAVGSLRRYFRTFGTQGGSEEGPGYWAYGMGYAVILLAALEGEGLSTGGLTRLPALRRTGNYPVDFQPGGVSIGWGDSGGNAHDPLMYWLASRFGVPGFAEWEDRQPIGEGRRSVLSVLWRPEPVRAGRWGPERRAVRGRFYREIGWAAFADSWERPAIVAGFKCADLTASHGHLDNGSFVLWRRGRWLGHDLGPPELRYYATSYFSESRWGWYNVKTAGHSALLIGGRGQVFAGKGRLDPLPPSRGWAGAVGDASGSYGPGVRRAVRHFVVCADGAVAATLDEVEAARPGGIEWLLHSPERVSVSRDWGMVAGGALAVAFPPGAARLRAENRPAGFRPGVHSRFRRDAVLHAASTARSRSHLFPAVMLMAGKGRPEVSFRRSGGKLELEVRRTGLHRVFSWARRGGRWVFTGVR